MQRIDATHARWIFTAPLESLQDPTGFVIGGIGSTAAAFVAGASTLVVTFPSGVTIGAAADIDGDAVEFAGAVPISPQRLLVT